MQHRTSLNFVISSDFLVVHLLPREDKTLLLGRDSFFLLNTLLDPLNLIGGLDVDLYFLSSQGLNLDEHPD